MSTESDLAVVPEEVDKPEAMVVPYVQALNNLAEDKELVAKVRSWCASQLIRFRDQQERKDFVDTDGTMDIADRMYRVALNRDTSSDQHQDTLSNVTSTMFFRQVRAIHSSLINIFFGEDDLPAEYRPDPSTKEYDDSNGLAIARQRNDLARYTMDADQAARKLKESLLWNEKYGQEMVGVEWERCDEEKVERVPTMFDAGGSPIAWRFDTVKRRVKDSPALVRYPLEHCYFDAKIDDMDLQRCILIEQQVPYEKLMSDAEQGFLLNVEKIKASHLWVGDGESDSSRQDRLTNAGTSGQSDTTGLVWVWQAKIRVPIKEGARKNGKGTWDQKSTPCSLYWATFAGDISSEKCVCLRLIRNPYNHGKTGLRLLHSLPDDCGAYHMSMASQLQSNYWQATTNINQAIDNVTLRNKAPGVADGPVHTRDLTFRQNKLIKVAKGTVLKFLDIPDTTTITLNMHDRIESDSNKTTGADKPIAGEALGGRTSATESKQVYDQAKLPILTKADYVADQLFPWLFEMYASLWEQFSDTKRVVAVTGSQYIQEIKPAELYGPFGVRVTAVKRFENNALRRQEINGFLQNGYMQAKGVLGREGDKQFWRYVLKTFGFPNVNMLVPEAGDFDAAQRAQNENYRMLYAGQWVEPHQGENHDVHLSRHEPIADEYGYLPDSDRDPEKERMIQAHIQGHRNLKAETTQGMTAIPGQQKRLPEGLPGEVLANPMEAQAGAMANV